MAQLQFIETVHSTNVTLQQKSEQYLQEWGEISKFFGIYTNEQTNGKGLASNRWLSNKGENLLISFIFQPPIAPVDQFKFNMFFALSVRKFLSTFIENPLVKWPNDIYVNQQKMAGILIEHAIQGENLKYTIAGVGININQTVFDPSIPNPTSLALLTSKQYEIETLALRFTQMLEKEYNLILENQVENLEQEYLKHLYQYQVEADYEIMGKRLKGKIVGISKFGQLLVEDSELKNYTCNYKEIKFINPEKLK